MVLKVASSFWQQKTGRQARINLTSHEASWQGILIVDLITRDVVNEVNFLSVLCDFPSGSAKQQENTFWCSNPLKEAAR